MRKQVLLAVSLGLVLVPLRLWAADEPRAIIDKAIKALGGEEKLSKKAGQSKGKGSIELMGGLSFNQESSFSLPDKFKEILDLEVNGQKINVTTAYNGKEAWIVANGQALPTNDGLIKELKEVTNVMRIGKLVYLKEKQYEVSTLGESKVDGKEVVGIKVARKGYRDVDMYFDKKSGLPVKVERRAVDIQSNQEYTEERIVTEYQDVDGAKVAKKVLVNRDGKKFMEIEIKEFKLLDMLDDNEFAKP